MIKRLSRLSFRQKLFYSYLSVILVCCIMTGLQIYFAMNNELKSQRQEILSNFTAEVVSNFDQTMEICQKSMLSVIGDRKVSGTLHNISDSYYQQYEDLTETLYPSINLVKLQSPELKSLTIYSGNYMLNRQSNFIKPLELMDAKLKEGKPNQKKRFFWTIDNSNVTAVYHLIKSNKNPVDNYVVGVIGTDELMKIRDWRIYEGDFFLTDQDGNVLLPLLKTSFEKGTEERIAGSANIHTITSNRGRVYLVNSKPLSCGWTISFLFPKDLLEVNPSFKITTVAIFNTLVVCVAMLLILTKLFSQMFSARIISLNKAAREVGQGNFEVQLDVESEDEIGQLSKQFLSMTEKLGCLVNDVLQSKIAMREAELAALRSQIKPHFLYNVLSMINWMAIRSGSEDISMVATSTSDYYRTMLNDGKDEILLRDEMVNVRSYLAIQLISHQDSFSVGYDVPEELNEVCLINMILQPVVENAIKHGVDKRLGEGGLIRISACRLGQNLLLSVEDNGPGMDEITAHGIFSKGNDGYGLKNVQERIELYAGKGYGLSIKSRRGKGTAVEILLPII